MDHTYSLEGTQAFLTFPFKDPHWVNKFLILVALTFAGAIIPILPGIIVMGYLATMMNKMITENTDPYLPEWSDWGDFLARGIKIFGASFIYSFPIIIFMMGGYFIMVLPAFLTPFAGSGEEMAVFGMLSFFGMFAGMFIFAIGMFLSIFLILLLPPILSNVAAKNSFSAAFHFHEWWRNLKANFSGYLISIILMVGLYFFIMLATQVLYMTLILCILIPFILFPATAYLSLIMSSLFAATYRQGAMKLNPVVVTE